jgi:hypothetical protein
MDVRRSGVVEAIAGDAAPLGLSAKLANSIERSNTLHKTYAPVDIEAVRAAISFMDDVVCAIARLVAANGRYLSQIDSIPSLPSATQMKRPWPRGRSRALRNTTFVN